MIVRNVKDVIGTADEVRTDTWVSRRVLLKRTAWDFPSMKPRSSRGRTHIHYKNHLEAVWCVEGDGSIQTIADGKTYALEPGVVYALNEHDEHWLCGGKEPLRVICVFNPPLTGQEVHDKDGVYALPEAGADAVAA